MKEHDRSKATARRKCIGVFGKRTHLSEKEAEGAECVKRRETREQMIEKQKNYSRNTNLLWYARSVQTAKLVTSFICAAGGLIASSNFNKFSCAKK